MVKKTYLKSILICIIIIGAIAAIIIIALSLNQKPKQDIAGRDFSGDGIYSFEKEKMCCDDCLSYGDYEDSKDCLEIIREHGGIMHCFMIMGDYPHTFSQCKQLITR